MPNIDACIWYLIVGFVSRKCAVGATPECLVVMLSMFMVIVNTMRHQMAIMCLLILSGNLWSVGIQKKATFPILPPRRFFPGSSGTLGSPWYHIGHTYHITLVSPAVCLKKKDFHRQCEKLFRNIYKSQPLSCQWSHPAPPCWAGKTRYKKIWKEKAPCSDTQCGESRPPWREWRKAVFSRCCNSNSVLPEKAEIGAETW